MLRIKGFLEDYFLAVCCCFPYTDISFVFAFENADSLTYFNNRGAKNPRNP
jgi:hypothetical protein